MVAVTNPSPPGSGREDDSSPFAGRNRRVTLGRAVTTLTDDGVVLSGRHVPAASHQAGFTAGPNAAASGNSVDRSTDLTFVVAHGFTNDTSSPSTRRMIAGFARYGGVVAFDFRGHGRSTGQTSVGRDESGDLDAAVSFARGLGYRSVAVVGFSLGGAVAIRQAATGRHRPDAVVAVSAPSRWYIRHTVPMRRVHWMLESTGGHAVGRALGIRLGGPWAEIPPTPLELACGVAPIPLLLVHGTADSYFGPAEARSLRDAAGAGAQLWIEPGMGHAESATSPELVRRIADWVRDAASSG
jgi:pimeloyl-ACP methyl ester carboxylesterase